MTVSKPRQLWIKGLVAKYGDGDLQAFADKVKIDRSTISLLYHGHRAVSDKYAIRISNRLKVDPPADLKLQNVEPRETTADPGSGKVLVEAKDLSELVEEVKLHRHLLNAILERMKP